MSTNININVQSEDLLSQQQARDEARRQSREIKRLERRSLEEAVERKVKKAEKNVLDQDRAKQGATGRSYIKKSPEPAAYEYIRAEENTFNIVPPKDGIVESLDSPIFPNSGYIGTSFDVYTGGISLRDKNRVYVPGVTYRGHIWGDDTGSEAPVVYEESGGPTYGNETVGAYNCAGLFGVDVLRTMGVPNFTPAPTDYKDIPLNRWINGEITKDTTYEITAPRLEGVTIECDVYFDTVSIISSPENIFLNGNFISLTKQFSSNTRQNFEIYVDIYQDEYGFYANISAGRDIFGFEDERYYESFYIESDSDDQENPAHPSFLLPPRQWNRISLTARKYPRLEGEDGSQSGAVILHINGKYVTHIVTSDTLVSNYATHIAAFEQWTDGGSLEGTIKLSQARVLEFPAYDKFNYTPKSLARSPFPLNPIS